MKISLKSLFFFTLLFGLTLNAGAQIPNESSGDFKSTNEAYEIETIIDSLDSPWSLAFLPNGDYLITELSGQLVRIDHADLTRTNIAKVPDVYFAGQGGLFDVVLDRNFANNQRLYLSLAHGDRRANATRLISAVLDNNALTDIKVLFTATPWKATPHHYGGRIAQLNDGTLLLTIGDGFDYREQAQKLDNHLGKIIRIDEHGQAPADNPWAGDNDALAEIWSLGHRNEQAILVTPDGVVYENEHGPKGGDEINVILPGQNYGWPVITNGRDYNGASITPYREYEGMQQPFVDWTPSIAPSGMALYQGEEFPSWQGDLLVTSLAEKSIRRIQLDKGNVVANQKVFPELNFRMRDIRVNASGHIYVLSDGDNGQLIRVSAGQ